VTDKVVDASAVAAIVFVEPAFQVVDRRITGRKLAAPAILPFEMTNICLKKIRAHPDRREAILRGFATYQRAVIDLHEVDQYGVVELADRYKLSAYDASYLWLAKFLDVELVTLDRRLETAATANG
jgi:predicted nucleic acid-binding protein